MFPQQAAATSPLRRHFMSSGDESGLAVSVLTGEFTADDVRAFAEHAARAIASGSPRRALVDLRSLRSIAPEAFGYLLDEIVAIGEQLPAGLHRIAIVRSDDLVGAAIAGIPNLVPLPQGIEVFDDIDRAFAWLDAAPPRLRDELEALHSTMTPGAPLLREVRRCIEVLGESATGSAIAAKLGRSPAQLIGELAPLGTSLRAEIVRGRMRAERIADLERSSTHRPRADHEDPPSPSIAIDRKRRRFASSTGAWVSLDHRSSLWNLLDALVTAHERFPNHPINVAELTRAGWPDECVAFSAVTRRLYTALSVLRRMGLDKVIVRRSDGYLLRGEISIVDSAAVSSPNFANDRLALT